MEDLQTLAQDVIKTFTKRNKTIFTAESCTAGLLASTLADISGSSAVLLGGIVAYQNEIKQKFLKVSEETLSQYSDVSFETAYEMAKGALAQSDADYAVSITGFAGPTGGNERDSVGTVYMTILSKDESGWGQKFKFEGDRQSVRQKAVEVALRLLISTEKEEDFFDFSMCDAREY
ncbi:MAG: CinA family protein [Brevinema sp.]